MKKRLNEIFSISRNERIGLVCIILLIAGFMIFSVLSPEKKPLPENIETVTAEFTAAVDSAKTDTVPKKKRKSKNTSKKVHRTLTAADLIPVDTFNRY